MTRPLRCEDVRAAASAHRDRKLGAARAARIDAHLRVCADCRALHARDGRIARLSRAAAEERIHPEPAVLAARIRGRLVERALAEARRPAWQRGPSRAGRRLRPVARRIARSRITIAILVGLGLLLAFEAGRRQTHHLEPVSPPPTPPLEDVLRPRPEEALPGLRRLLREFDAEERFRRTWSAPEASDERRAGLVPEDFQLVSARRRSNSRVLRAPAELARLLDALPLETDFDVLIEARILRGGRLTQVRLRRRAGGELEILDGAAARSGAALPRDD